MEINCARRVMAFGPKPEEAIQKAPCEKRKYVNRCCGGESNLDFLNRARKVVSVLLTEFARCSG